jgi:hypothetical protein
MMAGVCSSSKHHASATRRRRPGRRPAFVQQILDPDPAEGDTAADLAQAGGSAATLLAIEAGRRRHQLGDRDAALGDGDLYAPRHLGEQRARPVLGLIRRDLHVASILK